MDFGNKKKTEQEILEELRSIRKDLERMTTILSTTMATLLKLEQDGRK